MRSIRKSEIFDASKSEILTAFGRNLKEAIKEFNLDEKIEQLDLKQAIKMGVTSCPAIIINGEIKSRGNLLSVEELKKC